MSLVERDGVLRAGTIENVKGETLQHGVRSHVPPGPSLTTNEAPGYRGPGGDCHHHTVNHSASEYFRHYHAHADSIESVWALLKRRIIGIHRWVSSHLFRYVDEMSWRYNRRDTGVGARVNALIVGADDRLTDKVPIA